MSGENAFKQLIPFWHYALIVVLVCDEYRLTIGFHRWWIEYIKSIWQASQAVVCNQ